MADPAAIFNNIQQPNPLQTANQAIGLANAYQQNKLMQIQQQKQSLDLQQQQGSLALGHLITDHINPDSTVDYNGVMSDPRFKTIPFGAQLLQPMRLNDTNVTEQTVPDGQGGFVTQKMTNAQLGAQVSANSSGGNQSAPASNPSTAGNNWSTPPQPKGAGAPLPVGLSKNIEQSQDDYNNIVQQGQNARQSANVYRNIINLSKNAPTGTFVSDIYRALAKAGLTSGKDSDPTVQLQEISKYMGNAVQMAGGGTGTNEQLHAIQSANPNDAQLPQTIQNLSKYLLSNSMIPAAKADALISQVPDRGNYQAKQKFDKEWIDNADPRVFQAEISTPEERKSLLKNLTPDELKILSNKRAKLKSLGALDNLQ